MRLSNGAIRPAPSFCQRRAIPAEAGSVHRLGPGDGILAEDLMGKGHTTRAVGNDTRVVVIPLAG